MRIADSSTFCPDEVLCLSARLWVFFFYFLGLFYGFCSVVRICLRGAFSVSCATVYLKNIVHLYDMSEPAQASVLHEGLDVGNPSPCNIKDMPEAVHVEYIDFPFMSSKHCQNSSTVQKVASDTNFVNRDLVFLPVSILYLFNYA